MILKIIINHELFPLYIYMHYCRAAASQNYQHPSIYNLSNASIHM